MMDVPLANQKQWAGQNAWCLSSSPAAVHPPVASVHKPCLNSSSCEHLQSSAQGWNTHHSDLGGSRQPNSACHHDAQQGVWWSVQDNKPWSGGTDSVSDMGEGLQPPYCTHPAIAPPTHLAVAPPTHGAIAPPTHPAMTHPTHPAVSPPTHSAVAPPTHSAVAAPTHPAVTRPTHPAVTPPTHSAVAPPTHSAVAPPTHPAVTRPTHPAVAPPTHPAVTRPTHSAVTRPTHPAVTPPTHSAVAPPTHPAVTRPTHPAVAPPTHPAVTRPTHPAVAPPTHPAVTRPTHSAVAPPTHPAVTHPTHPAVALPTHPAVTRPTHPAVAPPTHLAVTRPTHPAVTRPTHPPVAPPTYSAVAPPTHSAVAPPTHLSVAPPTHPAVNSTNAVETTDTDICSHCQAPPTSAQKQPQWACPPDKPGSTNPDEAAHHANLLAHHANTLAQSAGCESRYGLDPELLPSAIKVMSEDRSEWDGQVFVSECPSALPPLATTSCIIEDRGNASPLAIRATCYCIPCEGETVVLSCLPLGALVSPLGPLRPLGPQQEALPVCTEAECVVGCTWCGASMCPAMGWQDCGQRFYCPFCGKLSEVPWQQYQPTRGAGLRLDKDQRPELSLGSYEVISSHKGEAPVLLLAVDVSLAALTSADLKFVTRDLHTVLHCLNRMDSWSHVRVGLMTYDDRIHLYDLNPRWSRPHMLVITEPHDMQLPVMEGLLVPLNDAIEAIDSVLQMIPHFSAVGTQLSGVSVDAPVTAALTVLQALNCPGKLLIFHSAPLIEPGNILSPPGIYGPSKTKSIFQTPEAAVSLAKQCVTQGCGVHLFVLSQQDVGGAWPGHLPYLTGGALHTYNHLQGELEQERFINDLRRTVETETVYRCELKLFISTGLRVSGCYGLFVPGPNPNRIAMATLDSQTMLAVELTHCRRLEDSRAVTIQSVLKYVSQTGVIRTRVHTLTLRSSQNLQDTFRQYQDQTVLTFYCKKIDRPLQEVREELQTHITRALAAYRKYCCSTSVSSGQLVLPQYLRALPVYINSLRKSEVLLPGTSSSVHQRMHQRCEVLAMDAASTAMHFYPLLLRLPVSADSITPPHPEEALRCTSSSLQSTSVYLLSTPLTLLLWVGRHVPACTLLQLFNYSCFCSLPSGQIQTLPVLKNSLSVWLRSLVTKHSTTGQLMVVKQGESGEQTLQRHLVEDKTPNGGASYADFLFHLHVNSVHLLQ